MTSREARRTDVAVWAPFVFLPFVWFVTSACLDTFADATTPQPDGGYGGSYNQSTGMTSYALPVYEYPDQTRYGSNVVCTTGGGYGGGSDGELSSTRATVAGEVEKNRQGLAQAEDKIKRCAGKERTEAQIDAKNGCNRAMHTNHFLEPSAQKSPEVVANEERCIKSNTEKYDPNTCKDGDVARAQRDAAYYRSQLATEQGRLSNIDACIADKRRREQAQPGSQGIDPAILLSIPGLLAPRPPRSGGGTSKPPPAHSGGHTK